MLPGAEPQSSIAEGASTNAAFGECLLGAQDPQICPDTFFGQYTW